jgi:hypothetical protein
MKIKIGFFWLSMITIITLSSCRNNFEWININPEKIQLARKPQPVVEKEVKKVSIQIDLKEKDNEIYFNESTGFFADDDQKQNLVNTPILNQNTTIISNNKKAPKAKSNYKGASKTQAGEKPVVNTPKVTERKTEIPKIKEATSEDKLNSALIIPSKPSIIENNPSKKAIFKSNSETENQMRSNAIEDIKKQNPELENKQSEKTKRGEYLMFGGLILAVFGAIMGVVFGKTAYIISIVGVVFAGIGAVMKYYLG